MTLRVVSILRGASMEVRWGAAILIAILALSIAVPLVSPFPINTSSGPPLIGPNWSHLFGTDQLGRDVFVRTFAAARLDLLLASVGVVVPLLIGTIVGGFAAITRSRTFVAVSSFVIDALNTFPFLVLVIAVVSIVGPGVKGLLIALAAVNWARYAKVARTRAAVLREQDFIVAAGVLGYSRARILGKHILPNAFSETLAYAVSDFVLVILTVSALSFLGAGVRPPTAEWGAMMADGRLFLRTQWWITVMPGLALSVTAIGVTLVAQGLASRYIGRG
jgi:peptide/nickel transport system permease protein